jgi:hypothetical protein
LNISPIIAMGGTLIPIIGRRWLLIFDDADNIEILRHVWPGNACGSILLTSRNFNAAHSLASRGLHLQPFDDEAGADLLLRLVKFDQSSTDNKVVAESISHTFGGLPLALAQIAGFITQRKLRLQDLLPLYERNAAKIDLKKTGTQDYKHTLSTVWEMTLASLSGSASHLQKLLAFLQPDTIHEIMLLEGSKLTPDPDFEFLRDEMEYVKSASKKIKNLLITL